MIPSGLVTSARVTHERADVDELAVAGSDGQRGGVAGLLARPDVEEAFVLSTCNRVEAYVVAADGAIGRAALEGFFADVSDEAVAMAGHDESLKHLLRVACGLESVVLGEDQILGQAREAYEDARSVGGVGPLLEMAVTKAIHVGERARTETAINEGIVSLGSAAVRLAAAERSLEGATALVVGAGEMGRLAARSLAAAPVEEVVVANRTVPHAEHVAAELEDVATEVVPLGALPGVASRADVVVAATGSDEPLLRARHLGEREQIVVDLGQPRDVDPAAAALANVTVYDLDDLESVTDRTRGRRTEAAREVEAMIEREFDRLHGQYKRARADDVIATMYESAERIKRRELETALSRLDGLDEGDREVIEAMADSLVGQLLAPPTKSLRDAAETDDWTTINTALQLFDPSFGDDRPPASAFADVGAGGTGNDAAGDAGLDVLTSGTRGDAGVESAIGSTDDD